MTASITESLRFSAGNDSQSSHDADDGFKNNGSGRNTLQPSSKSLFRKDSLHSSQGGSEPSGGSGSDHGGLSNSDSQRKQRRRDTKTAFRLPTFLTQASNYSSPANDENHERQFSKVRSIEGGESEYARTIRRYAVGQYALISNHSLDEGTNYLVNRYGFPEGGGGVNPEQRRGPYIYLLTQAKSVHFGEDAQYYTVSRFDNDEEQRADARWMVPITDPIGIEAAKTAAKKQNGGSYVHDYSHGDRMVLRSVSKATKRCIQLVHIGASLLHRKTKEQAAKCLNGQRPYKISFKFTGVNFLVLCNLWYLYIDQVRLAFFPHSADFACSVVSW